MASGTWRIPLRRIAPVAVVLALTIAGYLVANLVGKRDARRDSEHRAEVAAAQIRGRITDAASLAASLGRYMASVEGTGVTNEEFASTALRWLSPAGFPAAGWVEEVRAADRAAYEKRTGNPIVMRDQRRRIVSARSRSSYLPATLVSGIPPITVAGIDLGGESGMAGALVRARALHQPSATPLATLQDGTAGLFLISLAQRGGLVAPGFAVVFVSGESLRAVATDTTAVQLSAGDAPTRGPDDAAAVRKTFTEAGQRFDVVVPLEAVPGSAAVLQWIILAAGLVLAALAAALGVSGARRARAQDELDRIFTLSSDLIAVANFDGYFTRVNPAVRRILGYTEEEFLARPYLDFIHPGDRAPSVAEAAAIAQSEPMPAFESRYMRKDGSYRMLEWTSTPAVEDGAMYGVARDVTDRHQAEAELARLAGEQAALRRVATLVAREAPQSDVFSAIAEEIGQLLGTEEIRMARQEEEYAIIVAAWGEAHDAFPVGSRQPVRDDSAASRVFRTGLPTRIDDYGTVSGPVAGTVHTVGIRSVVATPIMVEGRLWGAITTGTSRDEPLPPDTESRLAQFTELMATAIANTESHARADRLAQEQAALRRVATLVAKEASLAEVFTKVADEVADVVGQVDCGLWRVDGETITAVAVSGPGSGAVIEGGARYPVDDDSVIGRAFREGRASQMTDDSAAGEGTPEFAQGPGIRSAVACPIVVGGHTWGAMAVVTYDAEPFPPETEARIAQFSDLVATAIANTEARAEVKRLAEEQAALRRVATLVAEGASPAAVFDAVAVEMKGLLVTDHVAVCRYEPGTELTVLAHLGSSAQRFPPGTRLSHEGDSVEAAVRRVERSVRTESYEGARGILAEHARAAGVRVAVGAPIVVEGRLWGVVSAGWNAEQSPSADTEQRMAQFAQLLDTATANADSRAELIASRARLVAASDEARRRFERDLHDGVQQRLVSLALELNVAEAIALREDAELIAPLGHIRQGLTGALDDLREMSRGIHPAILAEGGLVLGLRALARRSAVPVELRVSIDERLADHVEVGAYYVVSEALTNAAKHARASNVEVSVDVNDGKLRLTIGDDGVGGADPAQGSGLTGLADRVAALGGTIAISSPPGAGTSLRVELPVVGR